MRSLLLNKWFTGSALVLAVAVIAIRRPSWVTPSPTVVAREAEDPDGALGSAVVTTNSPARYLTELAGWRQLYPDAELRRDPFSTVGHPATAEPSTPSDETDAAPEVALTLQAVSIHGDRALAVINRQVVAVGDKISGFVVEKITALEVTLTTDTGTRTLRIDHTEAPRGPGSDGDTPPSDTRPTPTPAPAPAVGKPMSPH